jgi:lysophospholipid acyltransferase (LPLAT)-like uncharacterized protein
MKIRHPAFSRLAGLLGSWLVRAFMQTVSHRCYCASADTYPHGPHRRCLYAFWHENLLLPCYWYPRRDIRVLISQHADGELIARICHHLGFGLIRGSTTRGGMLALRQMIKDSDQSSFAVTPDGPRGPRRQVEPGLVFLAAKTGLPIVPLGFGYSACWRLKTWDRFCIPKPFSRAVTVFGEALEVPPKLRRDDLERYSLRVAQAINQVEDLGQALVDNRPVAGVRRAA